MKIMRHHTLTIYRKQNFIDKKSPLELKKDFKVLRYRELKYQKQQKGAIFKPIIMSVDDMDKFQEKKLCKRDLQQKVLGAIS